MAVGCLRMGCLSCFKAKVLLAEAGWLPKPQVVFSGQEVSFQGEPSLVCQLITHGTDET